MPPQDANPTPSFGGFGLKEHRDIGLSQSALDELGTAAGELVSVDFGIYAECKPIDPQNPPSPIVVGGDGGEYYAWPGEFLYVGLNASQQPLPLDGLVLVGPAPADCDTDAVYTGLSGTLDVGNPIFNAPGLGIAIDTPVFEAFYNPLTDVFGCDPNETSTPFATPHKPNGLCVPTHIIPLGDDLHVPDGVDVGLDVKVQVTAITRN